MKRRTESTVPAETLASTFRYETLLTAEADREEIRATFADKASAARVASLAFGGFALGPFELQELKDQTATLTRRSKGSIDTIQIEELSASDEWRLFMGGRLDVIPVASMLHRKRIIDMPSVKVLDYPPQHSMGLLFNALRPSLGDAGLRRSLASLLDRRAIAQVVLDDEHQAIEFESEAAEAVTLPSRTLALAFLDSDINIARTAVLIRFQLAEYGIDVELAPRDISGLIAMEGIADMTLLPIPQGRQGYNRFLSADHVESGNITGYANPDFDSAYDANQTEVMDRILKRDLPGTLLYTERYFAAMRSDLCLDEEPDPSSWRWLASIYPCSEGQEQ
jgi:hypothetical protein